jgi:hypothetical protein
MSGVVSKIKAVLTTRQSAYRQTFTGEGAPKIVMADLARFCFANKTTFHTNARMEGQLEGRREVWLRINAIMNLSEEELFDLLKINEGN